MGFTWYNFISNERHSSGVRDPDVHYGAAMLVESGQGMTRRGEALLGTQLHTNGRHTHEVRVLCVHAGGARRVAAGIGMARQGAAGLYLVQLHIERMVFGKVRLLLRSLWCGKDRRAPAWLYLGPSDISLSQTRVEAYQEGMNVLHPHHLVVRPSRGGAVHYRNSRGTKPVGRPLGWIRKSSGGYVLSLAGGIEVDETFPTQLDALHTLIKIMKEGLPA